MPTHAANDSPAPSCRSPDSDRPTPRQTHDAGGLTPRRSLGEGGFSLLELLVVIAVIGILAALIFPSIGAARKSADRARTKVQFSQWTAAIESFRSEYGHYPAFDASALVNGGAVTALSGEHPFHDLLAGRRRDGSVLPTGSAALAQNRKRIPFHSFSDADFTAAEAEFPNLIRSSIGALSIAVLVDRNLDGRIDAADYPSLPLVLLPDGSTARPTSGGLNTDIPASGLRLGVAFYCADPNATSAAPQFILSWK